MCIAIKWGNLTKPEYEIKKCTEASHGEFYEECGEYYPHVNCIPRSERDVFGWVAVPWVLRHPGNITDEATFQFYTLEQLRESLESDVDEIQTAAAAVSAVASASAGSASDPLADEDADPDAGSGPVPAIAHSSAPSLSASGGLVLDQKSSQPPAAGSGSGPVSPRSSMLGNAGSGISATPASASAAAAPRGSGPSAAASASAASAASVAASAVASTAIARKALQIAHRIPMGRQGKMIYVGVAYGQNQGPSISVEKNLPLIMEALAPNKTEESRLRAAEIVKGMPTIRIMLRNGGHPGGLPALPILSEERNRLSGNRDSGFRID
jgi:hypothetical protein